MLFFSSLSPFSDNVRVPVSNEYLLDEIGVDTAENEPLEVWGKIQFNIHSPPYVYQIVEPYAKSGYEYFGGSDR